LEKDSVALQKKSHSLQELERLLNLVEDCF